LQLLAWLFIFASALQALRHITVKVHAIFIFKQYFLRKMDSFDITNYSKYIICLLDFRTYISLMTISDKEIPAKRYVV